MTEPVTYRFSEEKNAALKEKRGIGFEEVIFVLEHEGLLDQIQNNSHKNDQLYIVNINNYAFVVPFVKRDDVIHLKTLFASRKMTKKYLNK